MSVETIARRYGTALADVALESGETETIKSELRDWEALISSSTELQKAFQSPAIAHADKEKLLGQLLARTQPSKATGNFLRILLKNGRLTELSEINDRFGSILEERSGVVVAAITSARELPDSERAEFKSKLETLTGKRVNLNFEIDKEIIGGVITRVGSTVYDGSVRTKLENLKEQLISG